MVSTSTIAIRSDESILSNDRVFFGSQPDDVAIGPLAGGVNEICVLGVGLGGVFPALAALAPGARITGVERDAQMVQACRSVRNAYFGEISFDLVVADAQEFVENNRNAFDVVSIDLYASARYSPLYFNADFWRAVKLSLRPDGMVIANAMGLPDHLGPLRHPTAQLRVAQWIGVEWANVYALPHRRNTTLIGIDGDLPTRIGKSGSRNALETDLDKGVARALVIRAESSRTIDPGPIGAEPVATTLSDIDANFLSLMPEFVENIRSCGGPEMLDGERPGRYVRRLLRSRDEAVKVTLNMLERGNYRASFLPAYFASYSSEGLSEYSWILDWLAEDLDYLDRDFPTWTRQFALWQAFSALANPLRTSALSSEKFLDKFWRVDWTV